MRRGKGNDRVCLCNRVLGLRSYGALSDSVNISKHYKEWTHFLAMSDMPNAVTLTNTVKFKQPHNVMESVLWSRLV